MGEARRRRKAEAGAEPSNVADCLFLRDFEAEAAGGFTLAGQIIVRHPRPLKEHMERIGPAIEAAIKVLVAARRDNPDLDLATFNFDGSQPDESKLSDSAWLTRHFGLPPSQRVTVRVDPRPASEGVRLSDYDLKLIMGTH